MVAICNGLISIAGNILVWLLNLLPDSPFKVFETSAIHEYLGALAWIVPIGLMLSVLSSWLFSIGAYYVYQTILRWIKVIE